MYSASLAKLVSGAVPRLTALVGCWALASLLSTAPAGEARVIEGSGSDHVVIETSDSSVDEVLAVLAAHFEFAVERSARPGQSVRFSGRLQGSLDRLLERLLRHEGHIIVRSAETRAGISRVFILDAKGAPPDTAVGSSLATLKARLQQQEMARSGEEPPK